MGLSVAKIFLDVLQLNGLEPEGCGSQRSTHQYSDYYDAASSSYIGLWGARTFKYAPNATLSLETTHTSKNKHYEVTYRISAARR